MTGFERIAAKNIRGAINWIVGQYYNSYIDGYDEYVPSSKQDIIQEVYECSMNNLYGEGCELSGGAPKEMRFAGKDFCLNYITKRVNDDEDVQEMAEHYNWTN